MRFTLNQIEAITRLAFTRDWRELSIVRGPEDARRDRIAFHPGRPQHYVQVDPEGRLTDHGDPRLADAP